MIEEFGSFENYSSGYRFIQQTQPLQLAIGMTDSPVGFAMWIYNFMHASVQSYSWSAKEIITWALMYWIQGPYGGMRFYKENVNVCTTGADAVADWFWSSVVANAYLVIKALILEDGLDINTTFPYLTQPGAISEFPADIWYRTVRHSSPNYQLTNT